MKEASPPCNVHMGGILVKLLKVIITITIRPHKVTDYLICIKLTCSLNLHTCYKPVTLSELNEQKASSSH